MSFRNSTGTPLRDIIESKGERGALQVVREALKSKELRPEDFSLLEIWEATHPGMDVAEAVVSDSFPKITGELINAKMIEGYEGIETIGEQLTTTVTSKQKVETIAGFTAAETPMEVPEGHPYSDSTLTEKYVTAQNIKYGRTISVSEEMVAFDQTGQILTRAMEIGEAAAQYKEKIIVEGVQDLNSNVWRPSGVATAFYSAGNQNLISSNSFGESGMETLNRTIQMQRNDAENSEYDNFIYIPKGRMVVLVPSDLEVEAWQLANSALTPESAENAANFFKGKFTVLSSPFITLRSATTWYAGDFARAFWWLQVWPLQTFTRKIGNSDEWTRDIKSQHKVRFYGAIAGVNEKYAYKNTA